MTIFILLLLTAILWGFSPILEKMGLENTSPLIALSIRSFGVTIILLLTLAYTGRFRQLAHTEGKTIAIFIASGILAGLLGMWTYFGALKAGATSKVVPIAACYPLITAML